MLENIWFIAAVDGLGAHRQFDLDPNRNLSRAD